MIATASHDLTGRLVRISLDPDTRSRTSSVLASLHLHTSPVSSITYSPSGEHLLTSSWDTLVGLWESRIPEENEIDVVEAQFDRRKRRKVGGRDSEPQMKRKAPLSVLKSHTARVSQVVFSSTGKTAFSCSFDSTARSWDIENGVCTNTIVGSKSFFFFPGARVDPPPSPPQKLIIVLPCDLSRPRPRSQCSAWWFCRTIILWCLARQTAVSQFMTSELFQPLYLQPPFHSCTRPFHHQWRSPRHRIPRSSQGHTMA